MGLIILKAKIKLTPEDEMEILSESMGITTPKGAKWVIRTIARHADDIKQLTRYNSKKTILDTYDGETLMIYETFEEVFKKWNENRTMDLDLTDDEFPSEEED